MLNDFAGNIENLAVASIIKQDVAEFIKCMKNCVELSLRYDKILKLEVPDPARAQTSLSMDWLLNALEADNANIQLHLLYKKSSSGIGNS